MKRVILFICCFLLLGSIYAQEEIEKSSEEILSNPAVSDKEGAAVDIGQELDENLQQQPFRNIRINADPRIDQLVQAHVRSAGKNKINGFRIQVIQDTDRGDVRQEKQRFINAFPQLKLYETYEPPFYKLRAGNFTDRFKAYYYYQRIKPNFTRAFIVKDQVKK